MQTTVESEPIQVETLAPTSTANFLSRTGRRVLLASSLRLLLRRLAMGIQVTQADVVRLADYADQAIA
jgi:hypothetical protein